MQLLSRVMFQTLGIGLTGNAVIAYAIPQTLHDPVLIHDQHALWNYLEATNIATDTALIVLPLVMIWRIQTSMAKKASVFSFFALRIM